MKDKKTVFAYIFLIFSSFFTLFPLFFMLTVSFRSTADLIQNGALSWPKIWQFSNYTTAWQEANFSGYFGNSVFISTISILGVLFFATLISYGLAYFNFRGKKLVNSLILLGLIVPMQVIIIPLFFNYSAIGLLGTRVPVFITQIAVNIPFSVFLLRGFIKDIPYSIVESARMDGAKEFTVLWRIIVPIIIPVLVSLTVLIFMWTWNDFFTTNILINSDSLKTLPLGLSAFQTAHNTNIPLTSAASTMMMMPILIVYFIFQKQMIAGMTLGAVKE